MSRIIFLLFHRILTVIKCILSIINDLYENKYEYRHDKSFWHVYAYLNFALFLLPKKTHHKISSINASTSLVVLVINLKRI